MSAVKVLPVRGLLFVVSFPQDAVNTFSHLLRFLYLVLQHGVSAGELFPLGGQLFPTAQPEAYARRSEGQI